MTVKWRKVAITTGIAVALITTAYLIAGPRGAAIAALGVPILFAVRHDTDLGACLPLVLLVMIALGILVVLIAIMAGMGGRA